MARRNASTRTGNTVATLTRLPAWTRVCRTSSGSVSHWTPCGRGQKFYRSCASSPFTEGLAFPKLTFKGSVSPSTDNLTVSGRSQSSSGPSRTPDLTSDPPTATPPLTPSDTRSNTPNPPTGKPPSSTLTPGTTSDDGGGRSQPGELNSVNARASHAEYGRRTRESRHDFDDFTHSPRCNILEWGIWSADQNTVISCYRRYCRRHCVSSRLDWMYLVLDRPGAEATASQRAQRVRHLSSHGRTPRTLDVKWPRRWEAAPAPGRETFTRVVHR